MARLAQEQGAEVVLTSFGRTMRIPDDVLPEWYRLLAPSERHLDAVMRLADSSTPPVLPMLHERFQGKDPLQLNL